MNLKQITLFRNIIMYYQASDISKGSYLDVKSALTILDDLENKLPNISVKKVSEWLKTDDLSKEVKFKKSPLDNRKKNT